MKINELQNLAELLLYCDNFRLLETDEISKHLRQDLNVQYYDQVQSVDAYLESINKKSENIGPSRNSNSLVFWLNTDIPKISDGSRSGVN